MKQLQKNQEEQNNIELKLRHMTINDWSTILNEASPNKFNLIMILLCRFATDEQMRRLYKRKFSLASTKPSEIWGKKFRVFTPNFFERSRSYKLISNQTDSHEILYYSLRQYNQAPHNILLFPGNAHLFLMPIPCLLKALEPLNCNLLIVRSQKNAFLLSSTSDYFYSINNDFKKITGENVSNSTILGSSSGVMHALLMGLQFDTKKIVGISPGWVNSNQLEKHLKNVSLRNDKIQQKISLIAAKENKKDCERVNEISKIILKNLDQTFLETIFIPNHRAHNVVHELARGGVTATDLLESILSKNKILCELLTEKSLLHTKNH